MDYAKISELRIIRNYLKELERSSQKPEIKAFLQKYIDSLGVQIMDLSQFDSGFPEFNINL